MVTAWMPLPEPYKAESEENIMGYDESYMIDRETRYADEIGLAAYKQGKRDMAKQLRAEIQEIYSDRPERFNDSQRKHLYTKIIELIDKAESEE